MSSDRPVLGVTLGDPNGIGPEVLLTALARAELPETHIRLYADPGELREAAALVAGAVRAPLCDPRPAIASGRIVAFAHGGTLEVVPIPSDAGTGVARGPLTPGRFDPERAGVQRAAILRAADDALAGRVHAIVTGPINKGIFLAPDGRTLTHPGQSELLAERTGAADWAMMLAGERLRVVLATTHLPISEVPGALSVDLLVRRARVALRALQERFGLREPRLAVTALNPHAGEDGHIGREEIDVIAPSVRALVAEGYDVIGPLPADTLFVRAARGEWDAVLAMYHDQGLIPLKLVHFGTAVNVTLGLPIVRTSPDHGVAYDIAGQGRADAGGMVAALQLALRLAIRSPQPAESEEK